MKEKLFELKLGLVWERFNDSISTHVTEIFPSSPLHIKMAVWRRTSLQKVLQDCYVGFSTP